MRKFLMVLLVILLIFPGAVFGKMKKTSKPKSHLKSIYRRGLKEPIRGDLMQAALEVVQNLMKTKGLKFEKDPAKRAQMEKVLASLKSAPGIGTGNYQSSQQSAGDEPADRIAYLERRFESLADGEEKDSLALALAVAYFESKQWDQARRYASIILARDPSQPTAKGILKALPPE